MRFALINIVIAVSMIFSVGTLMRKIIQLTTVNQNPATIGSRIKLTVSFTNCQLKTTP